MSCNVHFAPWCLHHLPGGKNHYLTIYYFNFKELINPIPILSSLGPISHPISTSDPCWHRSRFRATDKVDKKILEYGHCPMGFSVNGGWRFVKIHDLCWHSLSSPALMMIMTLKAAGIRSAFGVRNRMTEWILN